MRGGFFDPDYARDGRIGELARAVAALTQRVADLEARTPFQPDSEPADAALQVISGLSPEAHALDNTKGME